MTEEKVPDPDMSEYSKYHDPSGPAFGGTGLPYDPDEGEESDEESDDFPEPPEPDDDDDFDDEEDEEEGYVGDPEYDPAVDDDYEQFHEDPEDSLVL